MKIPRMQWVVAALLCAATMINYADRLTLSVVSRSLRGEFGMSEQDYSHVVTLFLGAYAIMYAGSGIIVDRLGTRRGFAFFIFTWSAAQLAHAFAVGKWSLGAARFALGLAEPGNFPAAAKAVAEWFPASKRALGVGIFNAGSSLGSAIAPPMVAFITAYWGWRAAFVVTAAMGFLWMMAWLLLYHPPHRNRWITQREFESLKIEPPPAAKEKAKWLDVLRMRGCYTLLIARFFTDPVIYFLIFWLPEYLQKERGYSLAEVGRYAWVPFVFGDIGYVLGGWLSGKLIQKGWSLPRARKTVMWIGAAVMPVTIYAPLAPTAAFAIACSCFATFGHAFWVANLQTLPTDLFRGPVVGTASGFTGMGGAIGGMIANLGTGYLVAHFSYQPVFLIAGLVHPLSALIVMALLKDREFRSNLQG